MPYWLSSREKSYPIDLEDASLGCENEGQKPIRLCKNLDIFYAKSWSLEPLIFMALDHSLFDVLADRAQSAPDTEVVEGSVCKQVEVMLNTLSPRDAEVLRLYFGLGDEEPLTLGQIGLRFNVTRERVRQIKEKALRRLRHPRHRRLLALLMEPS